MRNITKFVIGAAALTSIAAAEVSASATAGIHSRYFFRGIDFTLGENDFADFGFDVSGTAYSGFDWYAGIWNGRVANQADGYNETDVYFGASKEFALGTLDLGYITYTYDDGTQNDSEVYVGLSSSYAGIDFSSTTSIGTGGLWKNGVFQEFTSGYGIELHETTSVYFEVSAGFAFGEAGYSRDVDGLATYSASLSVDHALSDSLTVSPYISYVQTNEAYLGGGTTAEPLTVDGFVLGASASFSF